MLSNNLYEEILLNPASQGANKLFIVSGYASAAMAFHHIEELHKQNHDATVHLVIGMTVHDGLSLSNHRGFQKLVSDDLSGLFQCNYVINTPPVHSKTYAWFSNDTPIAGYIGSANYSQRAFSKHQREIMDTCSAETAYAYYNSLLKDTICCTHPEAEDFVQIHNYKYRLRRKEEIRLPDTDTAYPEISPSVQGLEHVRVSLINRYGKISGRSGLNWGHRPNRNRNQAYIPLKADVARTDFFPAPPQHFTVLTDDGETLICVRAQDNAKAIETPHNNSQLGEYFRYRMGEGDGHFITMADLIEYGRTHIDFYKTDEETYYMDFSTE